MNKNRLSNEILLSRAILAKPYNKSDSSSLFCVQPEIQIDLGRARVVVSPQTMAWQHLHYALLSSQQKGEPFFLIPRLRASVIHMTIYCRNQL